MTPWTVACRILCPWDFPGKLLEWVAISFNRGSSWPRNQTYISCIGGQILYHWATWEAPRMLVPCTPYLLYRVKCPYCSSPTPPGRYWKVCMQGPLRFCGATWLGSASECWVATFVTHKQAFHWWCKILGRRLVTRDAWDGGFSIRVRSQGETYYTRHKYL